MKVPNFTFHTDDGCIAPLAFADAAELASITDGSVTQRVAFLPDHFGLPEAEALIAGMSRDDVYHAVRQASDQALIGVIGVHARQGSVFEIGYWFAADARGRGVASRSVRAIVLHLAALCPGCHIVAECAPANVRSWALLRRIGFAPAGLDGLRQGRRLLRWHADARQRIDVC